MQAHMKSSNTILLSAFATILFALFTLHSAATTVKAQSCPAACQANSAECMANSGVNRECPVLWRNKRCSLLPCAYRQACQCGACLDGCNSVCTSPACTGGSGGGGGGTGGTGGTGGSTSTTVPNPSSVVTNPSTTAPSKGPVPSGTTSAGCLNKCDLNKDGVVTKDDLVSASNANGSVPPDVLQFCVNSCLGGTGGGTDGGSTPPSKIPGDCSGPTPGTPDGKVNLQDLEYLRQELNKEVRTLSCDFDKSGTTDVIDFTNYFREGYIRFNQGGTGGASVTPVQPDNGSQPTPIALPQDTSPVPTRIISVTPVTTNPNSGAVPTIPSSTAKP